MKEEIRLDIELAKSVSDQAQDDFLDELIDLIERLELIAGGGIKDRKLSLVLDCRESSLTAGELMDEIGDFLMEKEGLVLEFNME